jgi:hypothetical protein
VEGTSTTTAGKPGKTLRIQRALVRPSRGEGWMPVTTSAKAGRSLDRKEAPMKYVHLIQSVNQPEKRYYVSKRRCDGCPRHERCFGRLNLKWHTIRRHVDFRWLSRHRARFLEPEYQERLGKRRLIERIFRHIKHNLGFHRFLLRGLSGARVKTFLVAAASVLRRLCNILKREGQSWGSLIRTRSVVGPRPV